MTSRRLHLHLGYPKTGTTTLQRCFFDVLHRLGRIRYLGMFGFEADETPHRRDFFAGLTASLYADDQAFDQLLPGLRRQFERLVADVPAAMPVVLSNEHFVQSQWSTTLAGRIILPSRTAARLASVFEGWDVSLMLAVRRQDALVRSMFLEFASRPRHANPGDYRSLPRFLELCQDRANFHSDFYDFDTVIGGYLAAFPGAPALVWTYETFRDHQVDVLGNILTALGLDPGVMDFIPLPLDRQNSRSNSGAEAKVQQWSLLHRMLYALPGGRSIASATRNSPIAAALSNALKPQLTVPALTREQASAMLEFCAPANARLAARLPLLAADMEHAGYLHAAPDTRLIEVRR